MGFEQGPQIISRTFEQRVLSGELTPDAAREEQHRKTLDIVGRGENGEEIITRSVLGEERRFENLAQAIEWATKSGGIIYSTHEGNRSIMTGQTVDEILAKK